MAEPPQGDQVQAIVVQLQIWAILRHFSVDFPHINVVLDHCARFILHSGHSPEGLLQGAGYGHKAVVVLELALKGAPEHPVLPLVLQFHAHIVVDPHHPFFGRHRQGSHGAGKLVGVEIHRQVIFHSLREHRAKVRVRLHSLFAEVEGQKGVDPRQRLEIADVQLLRKVLAPELRLFAEIQVHRKALVIQIPQQIHNGLLDPAHAQIILKKSDPLHLARSFSVSLASPSGGGVIRRSHGRRMTEGVSPYRYTFISAS